MAWYCDRCGEKQGLFYSKYNSKDFSFFKEHNIPDYINLCSNCFNYLDFSKYRRDEIDDWYLKGYLSLSRSSRYNHSSKIFDIKYQLLDEDTNLYWDENNDSDDEDYDYADESEDDYEDYENKYDENDSPLFSDNADVILQKELFSKSTCAAYKSLIESVNNSYQTRFASDFQTYVTRLGLIINKIVENKNFYGKNHYPELLKYICKDILDNDYLYKNLIKINSHANGVKHSIKDINIDIKDFLIYYNSMIDKLKELSGCKSFEKCHICHKKTNSNNQTRRKTQKEVVCHCCGRVNPKEYYRCPKCKKITCDKCYNREKRMCEDCEKE